MRTVNKHSRSLHSARKQAGKGLSPGWRRGIKISLAVCLLGLVAYALVKGCLFATAKLKSSWEAQCVVTNVTAQASISASPHVKEEHVREWFGLSNGCNLARIDINGTRERILREHPIVRELTVVRHLPAALEIALEERKPIARVNFQTSTVNQDGHGIAIHRWDVADAEGMVFEYAKRDSAKLPVILEKNPTARRGERLNGRALAALRLVELSTVQGIVSLPIPEIDTDNETYLKLTTADYNTILIDWKLLDDPTDEDQPAMRQILKNLQNLFNNGVRPHRATYTITDLDRIAVRPNE